jgi:hypothetical protein
VRELGHAVLPGSLATSSHDEEVPTPQFEALRPTTAAGPQEKSTRCPERDDGNHGVLSSAAADPVSMPRDAVSTISIETEPYRAKRLTELTLIVRTQTTSYRCESRIRQGIAFVVEGNQSRHIDYPVIHLSPLGPPRNALHESFEQEIGALHPIAVKIHPCATRKKDPLDASGNGRASDVRSVVQEGGLECHSHAPDSSGRRTYVRPRRDSHVCPGRNPKRGRQAAIQLL